MSRPSLIATVAITLAGCASIEQASPLPESVRCEERAPDPVVRPDGSTFIVTILHAQDIQLTRVRAGWGEITFIPGEFDRFAQGKPIETFVARVEDHGSERVFTSVTGEHSFSVEKQRRTIRSERGFVGRDRNEEIKEIWLICR